MADPDLQDERGLVAKGRHDACVPAKDRAGRRARRTLLEQDVLDKAPQPGLALRDLSHAEMGACRAPFPMPETRRPILEWPCKRPIAGEHARDVVEMAEIADRLATSGQPKPLPQVQPGALFPPGGVTRVPGATRT